MTRLRNRSRLPKPGRTSISCPKSCNRCSLRQSIQENWSLVMAQNLRSKGMALTSIQMKKALRLLTRVPLNQAEKEVFQARRKRIANYRMRILRKLLERLTANSTLRTAKTVGSIHYRGWRENPRLGHQQFRRQKAVYVLSLGSGPRKR